MAIQKVGVLGAGQMGNGITQVVAQKGIQAVMVDISDEALKRGMATIEKSLDRLIKKEVMPADQKSEVISRIVTSKDMSAFKDCDLVVEAVTEKVDLKLQLFTQLDEVCKDGAILCTNTSSISITKIASATRRPDFVAGMHFMNPVPLMKLVEGIRGLQTSDETFKTVRKLAGDLGKTFV